jgi:hypothetical protein
MTRSLMHPRALSILRLGCSVLLAAALAGAWEILAAQAPGSPLYLGMLPGPIANLRESASELGVLLVLASLLLGERDVGGRWFGALAAGTALTLLCGLYGAAMGMHGTQLFDLRADAAWLFLAKQLGRALAFAGLARIAWLGLRK